MPNLTGLASQLPNEAIAWLTSQLGPFQVVQNFRMGSARTGVWQLESREGRHIFKVNRRKNRWGSEVFAYHSWAAALQPYVPKLLGTFQGQATQGILMTAISGIPLREAELDTQNIAKAYHRTGQLLRCLHDFAVGEWFGCVDENGLPIDWSGNPLSESRFDFVDQQRSTIQGLIDRGAALSCFEPPELRTLELALNAVTCYANEVPVPTSQDYTPGNWLVDQTGQLIAIVDLEHVLWGPRVLPFTRLLMDYFPNCPEGESAFYEGYGACPPVDQPEQTRISCAIYGGSYVIWGKEENNEHYLQRGRAALAKLRS